MNGDALSHHTQLIQWCQRHQLQQQQLQDGGGPKLPQHMTIDKYDAIDRWCNDVNKLFIQPPKKQGPKLFQTVRYSDSMYPPNKSTARSNVSHSANSSNRLWSSPAGARGQVRSAVLTGMGAKPQSGTSNKHPRSAASRIDNRHPMSSDRDPRRDRERGNDFLDDDVKSTALSAKMAEKMEHYVEERRTVHLHIQPQWKRKLSTGWTINRPMLYPKNPPPTPRENLLVEIPDYLVKTDDKRHMQVSQAGPLIPPSATSVKSDKKSKSASSRNSDKPGWKSVASPTSNKLSHRHTAKYMNIYVHTSLFKHKLNNDFEKINGENVDGGVVNARWDYDDDDDEILKPHPPLHDDHNGGSNRENGGNNRENSQENGKHNHKENGCVNGVTNKGTQWEPVDVVNQDERIDPLNIAHIEDTTTTVNNGDKAEAHVPLSPLSPSRFKPVIRDRSTSNTILNVLSIDDCKMSLRYRPQRVIDTHDTMIKPPPPPPALPLTPSPQPPASPKPIISIEDVDKDTENGDARFKRQNGDTKFKHQNGDTKFKSQNGESKSKYLNVFEGNALDEEEETDDEPSQTEEEEGGDGDSECASSAGQTDVPIRLSQGQGSDRTTLSPTQVQAKAEEYKKMYDHYSKLTPESKMSRPSTTVEKAFKVLLVKEFQACQASRRPLSSPSKLRKTQSSNKPTSPLFHSERFHQLNGALRQLMYDYLDSRWYQTKLRFQRHKSGFYSRTRSGMKKGSIVTSSPKDTLDSGDETWNGD